MDLSGNPLQWQPLLDLIPSILETVLDAWTTFEKPSREELETRITKRFLIDLKHEKNRRDLPFRIYPEIPEDDGEAGRVDLEFIPLHSNREEIYFAFECKRLNVDFPSRFKTLAAEYVGAEGMMRFVIGKYSQGHPAGGMIGYVMDGETSRAIAAVGKAVKKSGKKLRIRPGTGLEACSLLKSRREARETRHQFSREPFTMHHLFLAV